MDKCDKFDYRRSPETDHLFNSMKDMVDWCAICGRPAKDHQFKTEGEHKSNQISLEMERIRRDLHGFRTELGDLTDRLEKLYTKMLKHINEGNRA